MATPRRSGPTLKVQPRVLILCEDSKSSLDYLCDAAKNFRAYTEVEIYHPDRTDPMGIVKVGIARRKTFEKVICVIDRDSHANFDDAMRLASDHLKMIVSYPCYEYWLLLHFTYSRAPYVRTGNASAGDVLSRALREYAELANYAKGTTQGLFARLLPRLPVARQRSAQALNEALADQGDMNPSTRMHELIDLFESLQRPALA
ncbi:RloB family protein [Variovorax sp. LjRoot175]|uniref:RloB family protein n=1 Tax=Variovorax sp. LjRoot175 TaxID=3342276 RepID=UPI003ECD143B